jgi:hypothetical protein
LKVGTQGVSAAMKAVSSGDAKKMEKALKDLAPSARSFVKEMTGFKNSFKPVQQAVQQKLFEGLGKQLKATGTNVLPALKTGMVEVAGALNGIAKEALKVTSTPAFKGALKQVFKGTAQALNTLKGAVSPVLTGLLKMATLGQPLIQRFVQFGKVMAVNAGNWMNSAHGVKTMTDLMVRAGDIIAQLGRIVKNVGTVLINVLKSSNSYAGDLLGSIERVTKSLADWSKSASGQQDLSNTFKTLGEVAKAIIMDVQLLGGALGIVVKTLNGLPGPIKGALVQFVAFAAVFAPLLAKMTGVLKVVALLGTGIAKLRTFFSAGASGVSPFAALMARLRAALVATRAAIVSSYTAMKTWVLNALAWVRAALSVIAAQIRVAVTTAVSTARTVAAAIAMKAVAIATRLWAAATWLVNLAMRANPIILIVTLLVALGVAVVLMYKRFAWFRNMVNAVWAGIRTAIKWSWENVIRPVWNAIKVFIVNVLIPYFKLLWAGLKLYFTAIGMIIKTVWNNVIKPIWELIRKYIVGPMIIAFKAYWQIAKQVWNSVGTAIHNVWNVYIKPTFDKIKSGINAVKQAFSIGVDAIKGLWNKLRGILKAPISFFVNTVYTGGVKRVWDGVRKLVPALPGLPDVHFAAGGVFPGYTPGRDVHQVPMAAFSGGEAVLRPEVTRALGRDWVYGINKVAKGGPSAVGRYIGGYGDSGGIKVQKFKDGGILGGIKDILKKPIDWAKNAGSAILKFGADKFASGILDPIINRIPKGDGGLWAQAAFGIPKSLLTGFKNFIKSVVSPNIGGGGNNAAVAAARSQIGMPYSWGGGGLGGPSYGIGRGANTFGFDCSGLTEYAWGKASGGKDIGGDTYSQRAFLHTIANPVPGAVGQPHPGHTYIYAGNGRIIEAAHTGTNVREVPVRGGEWWGMPPWVVADKGGFLPGRSTTLVSNHSRSPEALIPLSKMGSTGEVHVHNHGHIANQTDMERWLITSLERLRRRNKLPSAR